MAYGEFPLSLPGLIWIVCTACSFFTYSNDIDIGAFGIAMWVVTICGLIYIFGAMVKKMIYLLVSGGHA
ncbi:MAG: hypothetical protein JW931_10045 [Methanomicrobiaceae archaeon]|nr:hypothetical protein [Methanomicrobiaceae archaeon]